MAKPHAIIVGAGFTGCATAHDLGLRGFDVTVIDRGDIANGTSGRTHGLLHSGARYCVNDQESAVECIEENYILKKITPQCIEPNGGIFIALTENDLDYRLRFIKGADDCHIPFEELAPIEALRLEPNLNPKLLAAVLVPDGTFEPLRLALSFASTAKYNGAQFLLYTELEGMVLDGKGNVKGVSVWDRKTGKRQNIAADIVINATGAWAGEITMMAGAYVPVIPTPGIMVAFDQRLTNRPVNRLCVPDDGDIVLPQRRMVVVGTTSFTVQYVDYVPVVEEQIKTMVSRGAELIPAILKTHMRGAFMSSRPLVGSGTEARSIARTFKCFDHKESDNIEGLVTITGGKATTCRAMAEKTADIVCKKLAIRADCLTAAIPLRPYREFYQ